VEKMQKIDRLTTHRIADTIVAKKYDQTAEFGITGRAFSDWAFEYAKGDEELEQRLFDEQDEMINTIMRCMKKYNVEIVDEL